jgi:hypothetical protein
MKPFRQKITDKHWNVQMYIFFMVFVP